jgi:hypothetical protein
MMVVVVVAVVVVVVVDTQEMPYWWAALPISMYHAVGGPAVVRMAEQRVCLRFLDRHVGEELLVVAGLDGLVVVGPGSW